MEFKSHVSVETGIVIAEHSCFYLTISMWIFTYAWGHCNAEQSTYDFLVKATGFSKISWYFVEFIDLKW